MAVVTSTTMAASTEGKDNNQLKAAVEAMVATAMAAANGNGNWDKNQPTVAAKKTAVAVVMAAFLLFFPCGNAFFPD